jgi:phospholipase/carboxylesterase
MPSDLLPAIELETGAHPDAAIIWLHGLGADGNDFVPIVEEMKLPESLSLRFVFPHAPVRPVTINAGSDTRGTTSPVATSRRRGHRRRTRVPGQIEALIVRERTRGIAAERLVLAGFSQGGAIALYAGLRHVVRLAGIVGLSTYLVHADRIAEEGAAANRDVPIFMAHGTQDPMIGVGWGDASRRALEAAGYGVEWHTYEMPHAVVWEEIEAIAAFLARVL